MAPRRRIETVLAVCVLCLLLCTSVFAAMELPDKLKDIPLFPNSKLVQVMDTEDNAMAMAKVKGIQPEAIADFYKSSMKAKGWKVTLQAQQEQSQMIQFQKNNSTLHFTAQVDGDSTIFNLIMTQAD